MYNIICILTVLLKIHTNSCFSEKVQEVKFLSFVYVFLFDKKLMWSVVIPVNLNFLSSAPQQSQVFIRR